jgi:TM2 domain-containing membrane protein YozV
MTQTPYAPPHPIEVDEKLCSTCNAVIHKKAEICPKCGVRQRKPANKPVLLLLTFFLGGFGAHQFYLCNYVLGIFYLLFSLTGIPALIALIEFIVFAFTSREKIEADYTAHGSVALIVVVIVFFIIIIGILAAIAIPVIRII